MDELQAAVRAGLERIQPVYREVLEMRLVMGLSTEEIATRLGRDSAAVRKLFSRAIEDLRREIGDEGGAAGMCVPC